MKAINLAGDAATNFGVAVSGDGRHMAVTDIGNRVTLYALPKGTSEKAMGRTGSGPGEFDLPGKLCFTNKTPNTLLVAEFNNKRVQELTLTGDHVRFVGVGLLTDAVYGIAANDDVIVVGKHSCTTNQRIIVFHSASGEIMRSFGDYGDEPGQVMWKCNGLRITPDGEHILVAHRNESDFGMVSMFTLAGEFVKCICMGAKQRISDVQLVPSSPDTVLVSDGLTNAVYVYSWESGERLLQFCKRGTFGNGTLLSATALAVTSDGLVYVLDGETRRVQLFE